MDESAGLTRDGCQTRGRTLRDYLLQEHLEAALVCDRRHVYYLAGYWCPANFASVVFIQRDGPTTLVTPHPIPFESAADVVLHYPAQRLATMIDDQWGAAIDEIAGLLRRFERIALDGPILPWVHPQAEWIDLRPALLAMRRSKHPDELALLKRAIAATEAAYEYAKRTLRPGVTEIELFAGMLAAAAESAGEVLGEFGNDFQIGSPGGPPRNRAASKREIAVFDLSVTLRGYHSDMCRSFVVGGKPTRAQTESHSLLIAALEHVEQTARPGKRCAELYAEVLKILENPHGWSFPHHLGHGIGLAAHETPRLNPEWNDTLAVGDVFTVEPGLYSNELRAGLRIEDNYVMTDAGPEKLTTFPTDIV